MVLTMLSWHTAGDLGGHYATFIRGEAIHKVAAIPGRLSSVTILRTRESEMRAVNEFILSVGPRREVSGSS